MSRRRARRSTEPTESKPQPVAGSSRRPFWVVFLTVCTLVAVAGGLWSWKQHVDQKFRDAMRSRQFEAAAGWADRHLWPPSAGEQAVAESRIARLRYQSAKARQVLEEASRSDASTPLIKRELALLDLQSGEDVSSRELQRLLDEAPDDTDALFEAWILGKFKAQDLVAAEAVLSQWTELERDSATPRYYFGVMHSLQEDYRAAEESFRETLKRDENFDDARLGLIETLALLGRHADALVIADELVRRRPDDVPSLMWKAQLLMDLDRPSAALPVLQKSLGLDPKLYKARYLLGRAHFLSDQPDEAVQTLTPILDRFSQDVPTLYLLAETELKRANTDAADAWLGRYLAAQSEVRRLVRRTEELNQKLAAGKPATPAERKAMGLDYLAVKWESAVPWLVDFPADHPDKLDVEQTLLTIYQAAGKTFEAVDTQATIDKLSSD